jgi:predicted phage terminase large subunit-like protein
MTSHDVALLNALLNNDFESFLRRGFHTLHPGTKYLDNWHQAAIAYQLERIRRGEITRLIINLPPRYLKSLMVSVAFPAFLLGHEPWRRIFCISYGGELTDKHSADFRSIIESTWYKRAFPKLRIRRSLENEVITTQRGFRKGTTVMGALTGLGGDLFIIDDPQKAADAQSEARRNSLNHWVSNTLMSRLDNKETGAIIVVMQRVNMQDLSGYLIDSAGDWTVLNLAAIAEADECIPIGGGRFHFRREGDVLHPERESKAVLAAMKDMLGSAHFSAQYQQSPVPMGGAMIKRTWLRYYDKLPERKWTDQVIQSWDTAAKGGAHNCWSVCTTWLFKDGIFYLMDLTRGKYEYQKLRAVALTLADAYKPDAILIEDASTGTALAADLQEDHRYAVKLIPVERDKEARLYVHQAKFEAGLVHFLRNATWLRDLEDELLAFPVGKTDDQVDSISQALAHKKSGYDSTLSWVG